MVGDLVVSVIGSAIDSLFSGWMSQRSHRSKLRGWARAYAQGNDVAFAGFAQGAVRYRPLYGPGGVLVLSGGELWWTADPGYGRGLWHRIPNESLVVLGRAQGPDFDGQGAWPGFRCLDGDIPVVILCEPDAERYLRIALALPESVEDDPVTDAIVDPTFWSDRGSAPPQ